MAHQPFKILPGVDTTRTPTLNEAAISTSNLIRFAIDRAGAGLVQKLGGWVKFFPTVMPAIVRALWAWQDTNDNKWLAVGCEESVVPGNGSALLAINDGVSTTLTPKVRQDNITPEFTTTIGSNLAEVRDTGSSATRFDSVYIPTHVAVGGIIIFGFYQCIAVSANTFQIELFDVLGNPVYATAADVDAGEVAIFSTIVNSYVVNVELANHGFLVGDTYPILVETVVGGITLSGAYIVTDVVDADNFSLTATNSASATATQAINDGDVRLNFYLGVGPLPTGLGYGAGGYGAGGYGSGVDPVYPTGTNIDTTDWTLANYGEVLIICPTATKFGSRDNDSYIGGPIYWWSPISGNPSPLALSAGPIANAGAFVAMPQRQVVAWGSTFNGVQDPLLLRWTSIDNIFDWVASPTNRAGSFRLSTGSKIVSALQMGQQNVILTDVGIWSMQYVGGGNAYSINEVATGNGLIARKAVVTLNGTLYWMGLSQFNKLGNNGAGPMVCPVWDIVFQNLDKTNVDKIRAAVNSNFNEITWYYPSIDGGGEIDSYVKYNTQMPEGMGWDYGRLRRTAWINQSVLGPPIGADGNILYQHEMSNDADGQAMNSSFQTGYFVLNEADLLMFVDEVWPDMKWGQYSEAPNAEVLLTFHVAEFPNGPVEVFGPYSMTQAVQYITPRFRGRLVSIKFESQDVGSFWRLGNMRYRAAPDGKYL